MLRQSHGRIGDCAQHTSVQRTHRVSVFRCGIYLHDGRTRFDGHDPKAN